MEKIVVKGGKKLSGEVNISAAKNSVLPIIAATILSKEDIELENIPMLEDVLVICNLLSGLNCNLQIADDKIKINTKKLIPVDANSELIRKMRASFLIMGPMIAKYGEFKLARPGGCNIGSRPIELHLKGLRALGAEDSNCGNGFVCIKAKKFLKENNVEFIDRHIVEENPSKEELLKWMDMSGLETKKFFNTSGKLYKEMNLKDRVKNITKEEAAELLSTNGMLVKRPILIKDDKVLVGFKEDLYREML
mgnify:CR=1 FL=1